jgi:hypothetical protein
MRGATDHSLAIVVLAFGGVLILVLARPYL